MAITKKIGFDSFYQGDSFTYKLEFDNDEFDITGYQFIITFKTSKSDTDDYAVLIKRFTAPNNVYSRAGKVFLPFESTDTSRFTPGTYYYDIQVVTNDFPAKVFTILDSKVRSILGTTRFDK